jgi:hypothetical protein
VSSHQRLDGVDDFLNMECVSLIFKGLRRLRKTLRPGHEFDARFLNKKLETAERKLFCFCCCFNWNANTLRVFCFLHKNLSLFVFKYERLGREKW